MIKTVIDKLEEVSETLRGEYKQGSDGKYYAELDKLPDNHPVLAGVLRAKQHEVDAHAATTALLATTKGELEKVRNTLHDRLKGKVDKSDLEGLEESYKQKLLDAEASSKSATEKLTASLREVLVDREASRLASKLALDSDAAELLGESIQRRLAVEITTEGKALTRVLSVDGKPSAATLEDLEKEILATKKYAGLLSGNKSSGSSASGKVNSSAGPSKVDWLKGDPADLAKEVAKKNPLLGG